MPDDEPDGARTLRRPWRDALLLTGVCALLVAGLVHYGARLDQADSARHHLPPTPHATARLESAPSAAASAAPAATTTCWDGRAVTDLAACGLPTGGAGLRWVFPSLATQHARCQPARRTDRGYAVVASWECFERADGRPVTITYDQLSDVRAADRWFTRSYAAGHRTEIPGAHGGRCLWQDARTLPARMTEMYERFPYAVTVFAPTSHAAHVAWGRLVDQRSPGAIRGRTA